jgi:hypothetical protein
MPDPEKPRRAGRLITVAQIEYTRNLLIPTAYRTPVWRYAVWVGYEKHLAFMADSDDYPFVRVNIGTVIIGQKNYDRVYAMRDVLSFHERFYIEDNNIYIHFRHHNPPYLFLYKRHGVLECFSAGDIVRLDGFTYLPDLTDVPKVAESADPFAYSKMAFNSGTFGFNNTRGIFDSVSEVFGNKLNVMVGEKEWGIARYKKLMQYYISNVSFGLNSAAVTAKDLRELLSVKVPPELYTREEYPYLNESDVDKVKQDAYGYCYNVKGTCINWGDIYVDEYQTKRTDRTFRFARAIEGEGIEYIEIKQGGSQIDGSPQSDKNQGVGWTRFEQERDGHGNITKSWADQGISIHSDGTITIDYFKVFPLKGSLPDITKKTYPVRATGVFVDIRRPGEIIKDIISHYGNVQVEPNFDLEEFDAELAPLPDIGICLDKQEDIYAVFEKIQNGSLLGFQFMGKYDKYTARLDNPNRGESVTIPGEEILNLDEVEVNMNADFYATSTDIKYARKWYIDKDDEEEYAHEVNKSRRLEILDMHRLDKVHEEETLLNDKAAAAMKGDIILEDFSKIRPLISGIKLFGLQWFDLRIYDIIYIDFVLRGGNAGTVPESLVKLITQANNERIVNRWAEDGEVVVMDTNNKKTVKNQREFIGKLRCQILGKEIDTVAGVVTLSVRQRDRSSYLGAEYG